MSRAGGRTSMTVMRAGGYALEPRLTLANRLTRALARATARWLAQVQAHDTRALLGRCRAVGSDVRLRAPVTVYHPDSLTLGNQIDIGEYTHIRASGGVTIGDRVLI